MLLPFYVKTTREEIRVAKLSSRSVGCPRCRAVRPLGDLRADVLGERIEAIDCVGGAGYGRPCMSRTKSYEPSFYLIGLLHIMIPLVTDVFYPSGDCVSSPLSGKPLSGYAPTSLFARLDFPELTGPTIVTIDSLRSQGKEPKSSIASSVIWISLFCSVAN